MLAVVVVVIVVRGGQACNMIAVGVVVFLGIPACVCGDFDGFAVSLLKGLAKGVGNKGALMSDKDESRNHQRLSDPFQGL